MDTSAHPFALVAGPITLDSSEMRIVTLVVVVLALSVAVVVAAVVAALVQKLAPSRSLRGRSGWSVFWGVLLAEVVVVGVASVPVIKRTGGLSAPRDPGHFTLSDEVPAYPEAVAVVPVPGRDAIEIVADRVPAATGGRPCRWRSVSVVAGTTPTEVHVVLEVQISVRDGYPDPCGYERGSLELVLSEPLDGRDVVVTGFGVDRRFHLAADGSYQRCPDDVCR